MRVSKRERDLVEEPLDRREDLVRGREQEGVDIAGERQCELDDVADELHREGRDALRRVLDPVDDVAEGVAEVVGDAVSAHAVEVLSGGHPLQQLRPAARWEPQRPGLTVGRARLGGRGRGAHPGTLRKRGRVVRQRGRGGEEALDATGDGIQGGGVLRLGEERDLAVADRVIAGGALQIAAGLDRREPQLHVVHHRDELRGRQEVRGKGQRRRCEAVGRADDVQRSGAVERDRRPDLRNELVADAVEHDRQRRGRRDRHRLARDAVARRGRRQLHVHRVGVELPRGRRVGDRDGDSCHSVDAASCQKRTSVFCSLTR
jgi:hypothetical protein